MKWMLVLKASKSPVPSFCNPMPLRTHQVAAVMAGVPGASPGPRSASHSGPAAPGAGGGGFFDLVSQVAQLTPPCITSPPQLHVVLRRVCPLNSY